MLQLATWAARGWHDATRKGEARVSCSERYIYIERERESRRCTTRSLPWLATHGCWPGLGQMAMRIQSPFVSSRHASKTLDCSNLSAACRSSASIPMGGVLRGQGGWRNLSSSSGRYLESNVGESPSCLGAFSAIHRHNISCQHPSPTARFQYPAKRV